jgi:mannose-1-phosphate guanylyltransferase/mannose-6-phosphate isomerase
VRERITPLILSGGAGTRLWPASREGRPKQFLRLFGARSTFQETVLRVSDPAVFTTPIVLTNAAYRFLVLEELQEIGLEADIVLEPMRRDSGPAIAAGAAFAAARDPNAIVLALAADHLVTDPDSFVATCRDGLAAAMDGRIVTFGITPDHPATGYGYIRPGASLGGRVMAVERFVEKPDVETATRYLAEGYLWNSGNFMFRASMLLDEYRSVDAPSVAAVSDAVAKAGRDLAFITLDEESFARARPISIDYAVMEKTKMAAVIPASYGWSDVGSWRSVWELSGKDEDGNTARGTSVFQDARNNHVSTDRALVALSGVENLVVVATQDAILVASQDNAAGMKDLIARLKQVAPDVTEEHLRVHRPWGAYQSLDISERHQVKRITVKAGGRLSLQKHKFRSEHWIVVRGVARVTIDDTIKTVNENESVYIPLGAVHRLENQGPALLELIEVQTGTYFGEDDIIRLEDDYRRS